MGPIWYNLEAGTVRTQDCVIDDSIVGAVMPSVITSKMRMKPTLFLLQFDTSYYTQTLALLPFISYSKVVVAIMLL